MCFIERFLRRIEDEDMRRITSIEAAVKADVPAVKKEKRLEMILCPACGSLAIGGREALDISCSNPNCQYWDGKWKQNV